MFSRTPGFARQQMLRFAQHLEGFRPLLAAHVDDAKICVGSAGLRIQSQYFRKSCSASSRSASVQCILSRSERFVRDLTPSQTEATGAPCRGLEAVPEHEVCGDIAAGYTGQQQAAPQLREKSARLTLVSLSAVVSANRRLEFKREGRVVQHSRCNAQCFANQGRDSMVTIRDVAKESGFSSTTVSIVLNDAPLARYIPPVPRNASSAPPKSWATVPTSLPALCAANAATPLASWSST